MLQWLQSPVLHEEACFVNGLGFGGVGWRGCRAWVAAMCQYGSSSVVSATMAPAVLSSCSCAKLFQLFCQLLPASTACKAKPPIL